MTNSKTTTAPKKQAAKHSPGPLDMEGRHEIDITPNSSAATVIRVIEVRKQIAPGTWKTLAFVPADEPEGVANAACFTAAPKMLAALREASRALTELDPSSDHHDAAQIDDAIAEATSVTDWTEQDGEASEKEGWIISWATGLSGVNSEEYRLERVDSMAIFADDAAAWAHVVKRAEGGSELHQRALAFIKQHNPTEYSHIAKSTSNSGGAA